MPQRGPLKWWQESELVRVKIQSIGFQLYRLVQGGLVGVAVEKE